jgi:hypothetical protein
MRRAYFLFPVLVVIGFAAYFSWWKFEAARDGAQKLANLALAKEDLISGKVFVGRDGAKEAEVDLANGNARFMYYGRERSDMREYSKILANRFGVTVDPLAGCMVSDPLVAYADSYNAVVRKYVDRKFGPTAFEQASQDASRQWQTK